MPCPLLIFSQSDYLNLIFAINSHTLWRTVQIQISWLLQKPTDLDLHCLQRQGISGFSRTKFNKYNTKWINSTRQESYQVAIFLISPWKHVLWVFMRSASVRHFWWVPQYMFSWRNKKIINTFRLKKCLIWLIWMYGINPYLFLGRLHQYIPVWFCILSQPFLVHAESWTDHQLRLDNQ